MIRQSRHIQPAPRTVYLLFLTQFVVRDCVEAFFGEMDEFRLFFRLLYLGIVFTTLVDISMVVTRRFSREVAVKFLQKRCINFPCSESLTLSVEFSTQAPDQNPFLIFPTFVRALFGQRSPARAANGQF